MIVYATYRNYDMTEGKGPMVMDEEYEVVWAYGQKVKK